VEHRASRRNLPFWKSWPGCGREKNGKASSWFVVDLGKKTLRKRTEDRGDSPISGGPFKKLFRRGSGGKTAL